MLIAREQLMQVEMGAAAGEMELQNRGVRGKIHLSAVGDKLKFLLNGRSASEEADFSLHQSFTVYVINH
jgi:hypothetical protein